MPETCWNTEHSQPLPPGRIHKPYAQYPDLPASQNIYMNTANTMPSPATVTKPPLCDSSAGAPAVVALTLAPVDVDEEPVWPTAEDVVALVEAFPLAVVFPLTVEFEALPVAWVPAPVAVVFVPASVAVVFVPASVAAVFVLASVAAVLVPAPVAVPVASVAVVLSAFVLEEDWSLLLALNFRI